MDAVWQKIKADIVSRPLISALIVVTVVMSATLLTLALATLMNISAPYDQTFEQLNAAHLWLYFDRDKMYKRDVERIEALPGIAASTGLRYDAPSRVSIRDTQVWTSLRAIPLETPEVNRLLIQEGRYLTPYQDELLASKDLDDLYELSAGEFIGLTRSDGQEVELPVIGLAYNPMWDVYRNSQPPYIYVSEKTLRELYPDESTWGWSLGLRLVDPNAVDEMVALIEETLRSDAIASHTDWRPVRQSAIFDVQLNSVFLTAFSSFAILATILVVASCIGSIVLSQFRQIGILKAVGFTSKQILCLYLGQYLILSAIGSLLGLLAGIALSPLPLKNIAVSLNTTFHPPFSLALVALVLSVVSGIVLLATLGAALRGARANIIRSIATGSEAPRKESSRGTRLTTRLGLPMVLALGLNQVFARPFRSLMTSLNLTLGVIGIVFGLALNETLDTYRQDPSLLGIAYDAVVSRESTGDRKTHHLLSRAPGIEAFYGEFLVDVETPAGQTFRARAVEGDLAAFPFRIEQGRLFQPNTYEAIAGRGLLDWLALDVGDEITLVLEDKENRPMTWQIVGQYPEASNAGQMMMLSLPTVSRFIRYAEPSAYFVKLSPDCNPEQLKQYLKPYRDSDLDIRFVTQIIPDEVVYLQLAIFALSAILIGIALINVFNTSLLATQENLKTIGILKAVGMTPFQVVTMTNTSAGFLGLLAALLGLPMGLMFTRGLLNVLAKTYGFGQVNVTLGMLYVAGLIPLMVLVSMTGSAIPGRWAAKLPIVQVLRSE
jgi:putative ABC transport system permease protein